MRDRYEVTIKLPLPSAPLQWGIRQSCSKPIPLAPVKPMEFFGAGEALDHARKLVDDGYGVSVTGPDGREWSHTEILALPADSAKKEVGDGRTRPGN